MHFWNVAKMRQESVLFFYGATLHEAKPGQYFLLCKGKICWACWFCGGAHGKFSRLIKLFFSSSCKIGSWSKQRKIFHSFCYTFTDYSKAFKKHQDVILWKSKLHYLIPFLKALDENIENWKSGLKTVMWLFKNFR